MGSIYIYDVGTAPFRAPWAQYRGSEDIEGLRDDLLAIVDEPEFADTESNILRDVQGSDEYDLYRDLVDRKIDYFLIATGGSMDQLVAVRSKDDFRRFIDHMDGHYAADVYVGEDEDRRLIRASSGKFIYHNPGLTEDILTTVQVFMPKADYPSKERQWVDRRRFEDILEGGNPIKVDPEFPYVRDVALEVVQDQPYGGLWTSSLMKTSDGRYTTDWQDWCEQNMPYWVSKGCALLSINPDARIYTIDGVEDYHRLRDMYPYPLYRRHGRQKRLGHSVDWEAVARDYDGIHHERGMAHQVRSTLWLNPGRALKLIRYSKVLEASRETDFLDRVIRKYTIADVPRGLREGTVDFNPENRWRGGHPEYYRLYRTARSNPADTLVTNPNTGGSAWWYVTDEPNIEFRIGEESLPFTWFGGDRRDWDDFGLFNLGMKKDYLLEVQVEIPAGCEVFDARTLFSDIPQWVRDSLRKSTQIDAEELESDEGYEFIDNYRCMAIDKDTYRYFQNMRIEDPSLKALCSTFDSEGRTEFLIKLWLLDWSTVQAFLMESPFAEESGRPIVGWYEIERIDYNYHTAINLGLYMGAPASSASRKQGCSDIRVRVVNAISAKQR